jgi:DNA-binding MarR family transcriptional regulator
LNVIPDEELPEMAMTLRRGTTRLARRLRMERPQTGVPLLEISVLGHLSRHGPMTPGEIAAAERVQPQTLTRTLASLEARGHVSRHADAADRRRSLLSITGTGRQLLILDMRQRDSWLSLAMAAQLTATECRLLALAGELMDRLADAGVTALHAAQPGHHDDAPGTAPHRGDDGSPAGHRDRLAGTRP